MKLYKNTPPRDLLPLINCKFHNLFLSLLQVKKKEVCAQTGLRIGQRFAGSVSGMLVLQMAPIEGPLRLNTSRTGIMPASS
jgi:hypothetical protein